MISLRDQIRDTILSSREDGKRRKLLVQKKELVTALPQAGSDPRMGFTGDTFFLEATPMHKLTIGELRDLCLRHKDKEVAKQLALSTQGLPDDHVVAILKEHYEELAQKKPKPQPKTENV